MFLGLRDAAAGVYRHPRASIATLCFPTINPWNHPITPFLPESFRDYLHFRERTFYYFFFYCSIRSDSFPCALFTGEKGEISLVSCRLLGCLVGRRPTRESDEGVAWDYFNDWGKSDMGTNGKCWFSVESTQNSTRDTSAKSVNLTVIFDRCEVIFIT